MSKTNLLGTTALTANFVRLQDQKRINEVLLSQRDADIKPILLNGTDADIDTFEKETKQLRRSNEKIDVQIDKVRSDYSVAAEREYQDRCIALGTEAERKREDGKAAFLLAEPLLKKLFGDLLPRMSAGDQAVKNYNANLPAGAQPLLPVEAEFRWRDGIPSRTEIVPRSNDMGGPAYRVIEGRAAVQPAPLYDVLQCPPLRPDDEKLQAPGTPSHVVTIFKRASELPPDKAVPVAPVESTIDPRGSAFMAFPGAR